MDSETNWNARNAWRCVLAIVLIEFALAADIRIVNRNLFYSHWIAVHGYSISAAIAICRAGLWFFFACYFSGVQSVREFTRKAGLSRRPNLFGWWAAWAAIGISLIDRYGVIRGWTSGNVFTREYRNEGGLVFAFYLLRVISLGPFMEEVVKRGFLYGAFRKNYGIAISITIMLILEVCFHWGAVTRSLWTPACLFTLWIMICLVRERTGNVWNCFMCHAIFNAAGCLTWPYYVSAMIILLPFCSSDGALATLHDNGEETEELPTKSESNIK